MPRQRRGIGEPLSAAPPRPNRVPDRRSRGCRSSRQSGRGRARSGTQVCDSRGDHSPALWSRDFSSTELESPTAAAGSPSHCSVRSDTAGRGVRSGCKTELLPVHARLRASEVTARVVQPILLRATCLGGAHDRSPVARRRSLLRRSAACTCARSLAAWRRASGLPSLDRRRRTARGSPRAVTAVLEGIRTTPAKPGTEGDSGNG